MPKYNKPPEESLFKGGMRGGIERELDARWDHWAR
jgi:hypothetical protein